MDIATEEELSSKIMTVFPPIRRVLVIAPHPDDEVFGCGGTLLLLQNSGCFVTTIIVTNGALGGDNADGKLIETRAEESCAAAKILGLDVPIFWGLPDRGVEYGEVLVGRLNETILETDADLVFLPSPTEWHHDHQTVAFAGAEAIRRLGGNRQAAFYEVSAPLPSPNLIYDISPAEEKKRQAMRCFHSQLQDQPYDTRISGINNFRAYHLGAQVKSAEAFTLLAAADLDKGLFILLDGPLANRRKLGFATTGSDIPLVSVIVRSMDRPTLSDALDSIATQTYSNIEVVLVNAKGSEHKKMEQWCGRYPLRFIDSGSPLRRSRAANVGLDAAHGEYLMFLDDDDWFNPEHIDVLVSLLNSDKNAVAAYSGVRCVRYDETSEKEIVRIFNEAFDATKLLLENYIPFHAALFRRTVINSNLACRFDETFDLFEDWDFWLQLLHHGYFLHSSGITASYRIHGNSGVGVEANADDAVLAFRSIVEKWRKLWTTRQIMDMIARSRFFEKYFRESERAREESERAREESERAREESERAREESERQLGQIFCSRSWQLTAPLRWVTRKISGR